MRLQYNLEFNLSQFSSKVLLKEVFQDMSKKKYFVIDICVSFNEQWALELWMKNDTVAFVMLLYYSAIKKTQQHAVDTGTLQKDFETAVL